MREVIGIDIGGTNTKLIRMSDAGEILHRETFLTHGDRGPDALLKELTARLKNHFFEDPADALGLAVAALVDTHSTIVQAPNLPRMEGLRLIEELQDRLGDIPMALDNDVNAAALAEIQAGAARGCRHVAMVSLGTGVGGALILDGKVYRGARGMAAELGHILLDYQGPECSCGLPGHLESYLSTRAIVERAHHRLASSSGEEGSAPASLLQSEVENGEDLTPRLLAEIAGQGDSLAVEILADVGALLGIACSSIVHAFNPEMLVIGGGVSGCGDLLLDPARRALEERLMPGPAEGFHLVQASLGSDGAAIGAGFLALAALDDMDSPVA